MRLAIALLGLCSLSAGAAEPPLIIGALEERPAYYSGQPLRRGVRALFEKTNQEWRPFFSNCQDSECLQTVSAKYPQIVSWTIAFSGRKLGNVISKTESKFEQYAEVGMGDITSAGPVPTIGARSALYAYGMMGQPVYRPLVAITRPNVADPDSWKPDRPSTELLQQARAAWRKQFPKNTNCKPGGPEFPWHYPDENIKLVKGYASSNGWHLMGIKLAGDRCDRPGIEPVDSNQWYASSPEGEIRHMGQSMWLVDAGDYDADGKSEILFAIDDYNLGGYELFYDDFKKHARFEYSFH